MIFGATIVVFITVISVVAYVGLKDQFLEDLAKEKLNDEK